MDASTSTVSNCQYWMRVIITLQICIKEALICILHNYHQDGSYTGITDDEVLLHAKMIQFKKKFYEKLKKIIHKEQWDILCPASGKSNSRDWDITLVVLVIRYEKIIPAPLGGWGQKVPHKNDTSLAAFCLLAKQLRNELLHSSVNDIQNEQDFLKYWKRMGHILKGLGYNNMVLFNDLETASLKMYTSLGVQFLETKMAHLQQSLSDVENEKVDKNTERIESLEVAMATQKTPLDKVMADIESLKMIIKEIQIDEQKKSEFS